MHSAVIMVCLLISIESLAASVRKAFFVDFLQALSKNILQKHTPESKRRAKVCAGCDEKSQRKYSQFLKASIVEVDGYVCNRCDGCPIATKIFAQEPENICEKWLKK